ncbi:M23 family metallopeptidase [Terriglobus sp. 2YAB30_2]|uniref:M23 family metallopeptidase n=1 Tax=Terriglobus sp. 2YAB30_2 TaxID=3233023 RepID=UPI003F95CD64
MRFRFPLHMVIALICIAAPCQQLPKPAPFPLQMETRIPFAPTAFPSEGHTYLFYEMHLTNFMPSSVSLDRIEVINPDLPAQPIAVFEGQRLQSMTVLLTSGKPAVPLQVAGGQTVIVFMSIEFDGTAKVPERLAHRVVASGLAAEGAIVETHHTPLQVLGPPVEGPSWIADDAPDSDPDNHHRRGVHVLNGQPVIDERYAIDWQRVQNGATSSGDPTNKNSYFSYGKPVLAVADARVIATRDGLPENIPGHGNAFHPAIPITLDTIPGNFITLDLGHGQYAYYFHLQPGSIRVKVGEHVRRGQVLAHIGASGDAREPHLHFEVTTSPKPLTGEGIPYVIERYTLMPAEGTSSARYRIHELPLNKRIVSFQGVSHD